MNNTLQHHGVKGMKWGVRRYQNFDGSYTRKGLQRYKNAEEHYEDIKKKTVTGEASRHDLRIAKKQMNKAYKKLKTDKMADQGRELYSKGRTITSNNTQFAVSQTAIIAGSGITQAVLRTYGNEKVANISGPALMFGGTAVNGILAAKASYQNKRLRAYYSHHS